ncbi:MAG: PA0069 family radical SAM protein [Opitutaceae bacterium]
MTNPANRFERMHVELDAEAIHAGAVDEGPAPALRTEFLKDHASSIISRNSSPDIGFAFSLNPYRGCEHGCAYCYARPYHEYLGFSAGLDFESRIMVKEDAPTLLRSELMRKSWKPAVLAMSGVTDCYQPVERKLEITRGCLEVLLEFRSPVGVISKNRLVARDADVLGELARLGAARVTLSITTLDAELARELEPRTSSPRDRLEAIRELTAAGVPVCVNVAPIIPGLNDHEIPGILEAAARAGAVGAGWTMLRLPGAVKDVFLDWIERHHPTKKNRILARIRDVREGKLNESSFGQRMTGAGIFAEQVRALFHAAARRHGLDRPLQPLRADGFRRPGPVQMELFASQG